MLHQRHPQLDFLALGPATRALPKVEFDSPRLRLRELAVEMSCQLPRNMSREHR
jgi:hypothetical protein